MADKYWSKLAELTGLQHCPKQGPFAQSDGAVMGARNGYILAVGPAKDGNASLVNIMVRFPENTVEQSTRMALENSGALAVALETDKVGDKQLKKVVIGPDGIVWKMDYSLSKPKAEKVATVANALVDAIKGQVPDFQGKCEQCRTAAVSEILLMNGIPVYYCAGCQFKVQAALDEAAREYGAMESNLFLGIFYGGVAAVVGALAWGGVAYGINKIFLFGAILIGLLVAWAVIKGMGRLNFIGHVAIGGLTVLSVLMGDVLFYTLSVMKEQNVAFSGELVGQIVANFWAIETDSQGGILSLVFGLAGAGYAIYTGRAAKPDFKVAFTPLAPGDQAKAAGMS
ncbi:MAG: hypothetical protein ABIP12_04390 [Terriglobales bacterium]